MGRAGSVPRTRSGDILQITRELSRSWHGSLLSRIEPPPPLVKNQYCGDVGDLSKFALLRSLRQTFPHDLLGLIWYLTPDDKGRLAGKDGRIPPPEDLRSRGPDLYSSLETVRRVKRMSAFRETGLLDGVLAFEEELQFSSHRAHERAKERDAWFERACAATKGCDIVLLDPDNGVASKQISSGSQRAAKYALKNEIQALHERGQVVVCYQHATRSRPFEEELQRLRAAFAGSFTLRWRRVQARAYLVWPGGDRDLRPWANELAEAWPGAFAAPV